MRKTGNRILWLSFFIFVSTALLSIPPTEKAHGIIVKFRSTEKKTFPARDKLHNQMGTKLVYRPKRSPFDFVVPPSTDKQHDFPALAEICKGYQGASLVAECEINYDLVASNDDIEPSVGVTPEPPVECSLTSTNGSPLLKEGTLSPFWAQEFTGADLVAFPKNATRMGVAVKVAVLDQGFGSQWEKKRVPSVTPSTNKDSTHGALSMGLLTGPVPFTLQAPMEITQVFEVNSTADYLKVIDTLEESRQPPAVVQIAVGLGYSSNMAREALKRISDKAIVVAAAGNDWPAEMDRNAREFPGILVASVSPEGYPSDSSSAGPSVTIGAPSDRYLQSTNDGKRALLFGGTSGASAMVASAVAAAKSLVPDLTTKEMKIMLEKTALPTPSGMGGGQGKGSLNTVQFLAAADRIRSGGLAGKQRDKALASAPGTRFFKFDKEGDGEFAKAAPVFSNKASTCEQRKMAYGQLRRAFFLNPTGPAREMLAKVYEEQGLTTNAKFAQNMSKEMLLKHLAEDITSTDASIRVSAARVAGSMGTEGLPTVIQFAEGSMRAPASDAGTPSIGTPAAVKAIAATMGAEDRKVLSSKLKTNRDSEIQRLGEEIK